jgi:hypothetical protein
MNVAQDCEIIRVMDRGKGPYIARSASDKTDDWPFWYVATNNGRTNALSSTGGLFTDPDTAKAIAKCCNGEGPCICGRRPQTEGEKK